MAIEVVSFNTILDYARAFSKRNYNEIPDNWEEIVQSYIEKNIRVQKLVVKHNPNNSNFVMFAMMLLKDPYNMDKFWDLTKRCGRR
jgi:hypothetical protein